MKRTIVFSMVGLLAAVCAIAATNVVSVNVVGYGKSDLVPGGRMLRGMPFSNLDGSTNTLLSIFGTNQLTQNASYLSSDRIMVFIPAETRYQAYAQYTDGQFYPCNTPTEWDTYPATNPVIPAGTSMWIVRASGEATTNNLAFLGEVVDVATQQVGIVPGYQLVSYAFSSDIAIQDIATNGMTASTAYLSADRIVTWEGDHYQFYALYSGDGQWYPCNTPTEWDTYPPATRVLGMGEGFWFISQNAFTWSEANKYLGNL